MGGKTTVYVCEKGACKQPVNDPQVFVRQIRSQVFPENEPAWKNFKMELR